MIKNILTRIRNAFKPIQPPKTFKLPKSKTIVGPNDKKRQQIRDSIMTPHDILTRNGLKRCHLCSIYKPLDKFKDAKNKYTLKNKHNQGKQYTCIACNEKQAI